MTHPRDRFITVYGRKPVLEALADRQVVVDKLLVARGASGSQIDRIVRAARARGVEPQRRSAREVTRLSRNGRQDQGVALDLIAPRMQALDAWLAEGPARAQIFVLDGVTTPGNVGLIIRAATAAGFDGIVLPRVGCPEVSPLVIKASAGVALRAPILRVRAVADAVKALADAGYAILGLAADGADDIHGIELSHRTAWVLGGETHGLSPASQVALTGRVRIPMRGEVESLNVATAAAVVAFEVQRRLSTG